MSPETTALGAGPLVLEEEPQPDHGDEKRHRLREAHATTLLALVANGNRNSELSETESESALVSSGRRLGPMIVAGIDAHSTMGHGRGSDADKAA